MDYSNKERYLKELEQKYKIEKNTLLLNEVYYSNYTINEDTDSQTNIFFSGERFVKSKLVESQYNDVYNEHIERYKLASNFVKDKIVIDAACGTGYGSEMLAKSGAEVVMGFDISKEAVLSSKQNYSSVKNLSFQVGDVTKLSLSDKSADVFISFETIEHIKCGIDLIRESSRLLKENGLFIVSTPNRNVTNPGKYFNEAPMNPYHQYEYNVFQFMGDLLENYDIIDVYGQSMYFNNEIAINKLLRKCCNLSEYNYNELNLIDDYKCYKINEFKDIQPTYITMICRKK